MVLSALEFSFFEIESYVARAGLEPLIFLSLLLKYWDYRFVPQQVASTAFNTKLIALGTQKHTQFFAWSVDIGNPSDYCVFTNSLK